MTVELSCFSADSPLPFLVGCIQTLRQVPENILILLGSNFSVTNLSLIIQPQYSMWIYHLRHMLFLLDDVYQIHTGEHVQTELAIEPRETVSI